VPRRRLRVRSGKALTSAVLGLCLTGCAAGAAQGSGLPRDAIVVLGHRPARDEQGVEPELRMRTDRGIALYRAGRAPRLVLTGGHTGAAESEAEVMAGLARQAGVPESALRLEMASRDTIENAHYTVTALQSELGRPPRVVIVTSDYHVKRAAELFRCAGADVQSEGVPLSELSAWSRFTRRLRERVVHVVYWFFDECERAHGAG
jgi:uncharacterized SAM-binding protein YcdF (DUF218 family)